MRSRPRNRDGTPIDPVPFLVVALTALLVTHGWGPLYLHAFGIPPAVALLPLTLLLAAIVVVAYHQLVWTIDPDRPSVGPGQRLRLLLYAVAIGIALVVLLSMPFLV